MKLIISSLLLLSVMFTGTLYAGGFQLNEHGARAMGLGGAFTAVADDPSAIYFNAAGLTQLDGWNFMIGSAFIAPVSSFRGVAPRITEYKTSPQIFPIPNGYATYRINNDWAVGLGFDVPFGLGTEWPLNWPGRYLALQTDVRSYTVSADVAYKVIDKLTVSAGVQYSFADVTITEQISQTPFPGDAYVKLTGKDNAAFGYKFGLLYKPTDKLSFGASFHSQIKYNFKGSALTTGAPQLASKLPAGDISADLTVPFNFAFGAAYQVIPELRLSADFQYIGWSSYDTLAIQFANVPRVASPRLYDDSYIVRFGAEYKYTRDLSFQGGIYYDNNPVKPQYLNPSLPDANRICFSIGLNYKVTSNFSAGVSYLFIRSSELTVTNSQEYYSGNTPFNGTYNSYANIGSISLSYSL
ncbi:MAG: outer membrane protein transport protein [Ignavibacteriaceae bacterium]|nr:outer membrane protein transport protein [Ignavibacteriaceae bacterium]